MNKLSFGVVALMALGFFSCKTDVDVNAEPSDITIVYGLIDPVDSIHYIKINKAFLGEGSALELAANASNSNYADNEIDVRIDGDNKSYPLVRVTNEIPKESGIFDSSTNVLYKFIEPNINRDAEYKIVIYNESLDKEITASTKIVNTSTVEVASVMRLYGGSVASGSFTSESISIVAGDNIGRMEAFIVFNYTEYYTPSGGTPVEKKVILSLGEDKTADSFEGNLIFTALGESLFEKIQKTVTDPSTIPHFSHREMGNISIEYSVAGTELSTYMEAKAPSTTVNQNKPDYTNLTNGIGIFSSRTRGYWESSRTASTGLNISGETKVKLASLNLGFCLGTHAQATNPCPF